MRKEVKVDTTKKIRKAPLEFKTNEQFYRQVKREGMVTIYQVTATYVKAEPNICLGYEVHIIKVSEPHPLYPNKDNADMVEMLAKNEEFGKRAWFFVSREKAEDMFRDIVEAQNGQHITS
jgi:predicted peroxiredoxin